MARKPRHQPTADLADTVIARDLHIKGQLESDNDIWIDGTVEGDITTAGNLTLGSSADVRGNLGARTVSIAGRLSGDVTAKESISIESSALVTGNLSASDLRIESGAVLRGEVRMPTAENESAASEEGTDA